MPLKHGFEVDRRLFEGNGASFDEVGRVNGLLRIYHIMEVLRQFFLESPGCELLDDLQFKLSGVLPRHRGPSVGGFHGKGANRRSPSRCLVVREVKQLYRASPLREELKVFKLALIHGVLAHGRLVGP